ncbi:hypothetical protein Moror_11334 [Moniliophthora roreri MCA 2997]|uniref:Extracellular serine-rich protein n=1 Tax=Moniliophthora roreri (strain MCA 2997) TaxID=1381753 RepID=V2WYM3_MONRO|nr:hypothetical protein Moror_11334 [Moniliophthora roreri MCA 2997]
MSALRLVTFILIVVNWGIHGSRGQNTVQVVIGKKGNFYDPPAVITNKGDTVQFIFDGNAHGVVQSSFEKPCVPLPGGFSSGVTGRGDDFTKPISTWNLQITNASIPIWYYCPVSNPSSHCATGMVGVINPPNSSIIDSYIASAKQFTGTQVPASTALTGIGAFATDTPVPMTASTSSTTSVSMTESPPSTATSQSSSTTNSTDSRLPAIIGGSIAGAVAAFASVLIIVLIVHRRRSQHGQNTTVEAYSYPYGPGSPPMTARSDFSKMSDPRATTPIPAALLYPARRPETEYTSPPGSPPPTLRPQESKTGIRGISSTEYPGSGGQHEGHDEGRTDTLNTLAKEVAAILLRTGSNDRRAGTEATSSNGDGHGTKNEDEAPPRYRSNLGHTPP